MSDSPPAIAAIVPLYNGARFIRRALESILAQSLLPAEIVVVDDGSIDEGPDIVRAVAAANPMVTLLAKANGGQSSARNFGVARSKSTLIAFLDQDDAWYPRHLERLATPFEANKAHQLGWVYSDLDEYDEHWHLVVRNLLSTLPAQHHPKRSLTACLGDDMFVLPSASLIDKRAFEAIDGFDERLMGYEDDDLFLRLFRAGYENVFIREALSGWRIYAGSTSYSPRMLASRIIYQNKLIVTFPDDEWVGRFYRRDFIAPRFWRQWLAEYLRGVRLNNSKQSQIARAQLLQLLPYMGLKRRLFGSVLLAAMRFHGLARLGYALGLHRRFSGLVWTMRRNPAGS